MLSSKDIRELNEAEINARVAELEEERFRLKFRAGTETLEDPLRIRVIRKDIARLKTVLKEKIIGIDYANAQSAPAKKTVAKKRAARSTKRA